MIENSEKNIGVEIKPKFKLVELWLKFIPNSLKLSRKSCDRNFLFRLVTKYTIIFLSTSPKKFYVMGIAKIIINVFHLSAVKFENSSPVAILAG